MNVHTVWWLTCLALIKNFSCTKINPFVLEKHELKAMEGSCIEIKCKETGQHNSYHTDSWFWMKDSNWTKESSFTGTIVYSTYDKRPVSPLFEKRVSYINDSSKSGPEKLCDILICELNKSDSGNYSFRLEGKVHKWITDPQTNLTVLENPCPITFEKPPDVMENHEVTLTCSTLSSCSSNLKIDPVMRPQTGPPTGSNGPTDRNTTSKSIMYRFETNWTDDQIVFSCQTTDNNDKYLVKNVSLTVQYAPRDVQVVASTGKVKEGDPVTLTCSAKGEPNVTFSWFKNGQKLDFSDAVMKFTSAKDSHSGLYYCQAENKHGIVKSNTLNVTVLYAPEVYIQELPKIIIEGESISLQCKVKRSRPQPPSFVWLKDGSSLIGNQELVFTSIQPTDSGNYSCIATNEVGSGTSESSHLRVHYKPRSSVLIDGSHDNNEVSVNSGITFICSTSAYPEPWNWYSWFRYKDSNPPQKIDNDNMEFSLKSVQRADEACYTCNASNSIGAGETSQPKCIRVRFPPTNLMLSMDTKVREGHSITISCSVESFPSSTFQLKWSNFQSPEWQVISERFNSQNTFKHTFTATPAHAGSYICIASNSENTTESKERKLVVEYVPKNVMVSSSRGLVVKENDSFSLECSADSYPPAKRFTWNKNGNNQLNKDTQRYFVVSASPSDSGLYSCSAENGIGTQNSQKIEIKVKYAPKQTTITTEKEVQLSDGRRSVKLSCSSNGFPPAQHFWNSKTKDQVSKGATITVFSDDAGEYYCVAKNEMGQKSSDPIEPFGGRVKKIVLLVLFIFFFFILVLIIILYRRKSKRSIQQGTANTCSCDDFLQPCWTRARRRNTVNEMGLVGPFRSRDDLLPDQPCRPNGRRHQPRPDVTSASNINTVYCNVNPSQGKQAPSAQKPARQQGGHKEDDSLNYASLHFQKKQKIPEEEVVYSKVSKPKPSKEKEEGGLGDYENISTLDAVKPSNLYESDSDTSEDDEEDVNYTQVNIRQQRAKRDSSSSEDATEYSQVVI